MQLGIKRLCNLSKVTPRVNFSTETLTQVIIILPAPTSWRVHITPLSQCGRQSCWGVFTGRCKGHPSSSASSRLKKQQDFKKHTRDSLLILRLYNDVLLWVCKGRMAQRILPSAFLVSQCHGGSCQDLPEDVLDFHTLSCSCFRSLFSFPPWRSPSPSNIPRQNHPFKFITYFSPCIYHQTPWAVLPSVFISTASFHSGHVFQLILRILLTHTPPKSEPFWRSNCQIQWPLPSSHNQLLCGKFQENFLLGTSSFLGFQEITLSWFSVSIFDSSVQVTSALSSSPKL